MSEELMKVINYLQNKEIRRLTLSRDDLVEKLFKTTKKQKIDPKLAVMSYITAKVKLLNEMLNDSEFKRQDIEDILIDVRFACSVLFQVLLKEFGND